MSRWMFLSEVDFGDLDCKTTYFLFEGDELLEKVKKVYNKFKHIINVPNKFETFMTYYNHNQVDLDGKELNDYNYDKFLELLFNLFEIIDDGGCRSHTLVSMHLYKIDEEYTGEK